jgi:hypothetical protein
LNTNYTATRAEQHALFEKASNWDLLGLWGLNMARVSDRTWIFVSHASADLKAVRQVRNYLEEKDASPLLFHLLALEHEEEFWPVIEREIVARDFFLYCESEAAARSPWVERERAAVAKAQGRKTKRVSAIRVDDGELDLRALDAFIATTRVFPSFKREDKPIVAPFLDELEGRGFEVFNDLEMLVPGDDWQARIVAELDRASTHGWVIAFLSQRSMQSPWVQREIHHAQYLGARFVPVLIDPGLSLATLPPNLRVLHLFDATRDPITAPQRLADELHLRSPR